MTEATVSQDITVDLTPEEIARVDALIPQYSTPEHQATREEALRAILAAGLHAIETRGASLERGEG